MKSVLKKQILHYSDAQLTSKDDHIVIEEPLEIILSFKYDNLKSHFSWLTTMRTPGQDDLLIRGLLFSENIIYKESDLHFIKHIDNNQNTVEVYLKHKPATESRSHIVSTSCGLCGKSTIEDMIKKIIYIPLKNYPLFAKDKILSLPKAMKMEMPIFNITGGIHACAIFDFNGNPKIIKEDVGRHNAMDKLIGECLKKDLIPLNQFGSFLSGRASFELIQKAAMAGIPLVVSVGAPTSLAIQLAEECGITLLGFLKSGSFNIYSHPERVE